MVSKPSDEMAQHQGTRTVGGRDGMPGTDITDEKQSEPGLERRNDVYV